MWMNYTSIKKPHVMMKNKLLFYFLKYDGKYFAALRWKYAGFYVTPQTR